MSLCGCNKPDCIQCLIQNTFPQDPPNFMRPGIDAIVFTARVPERKTELERETDTARLWALHALLDNFAFLMQEMGLQTSLTTRANTPKH